MLRTTLILCACSTTWVVGFTEAGAETASLDVKEEATPHSLGVGVTFGQPTKLSLTYRLPNVPLAVAAGLGTGIWSGTGLHLDASLAWQKAISDFRISLGAGYRYYDHHYAPRSLDELDRDGHHGPVALLGFSWMLSDSPIEIFGELMPGLDLGRTESCTFASGVNTICPHEDERDWFVNLGVGARYWFQL